MRLLYILLATAILSQSCKKNTPNRSAYTQQMCGTRNFHLVYGGYNPYLKQYTSDSSDISTEVKCKDAGAVLFYDNLYIYDSIDNNGLLHFHLVSSEPFHHGHLTFNHVGNVIDISEQQHVSAGAGEWSYHYTSY